METLVALAPVLSGIGSAVSAVSGMFGGGGGAKSAPAPMAPPPPPEPTVIPTADDNAMKTRSEQDRARKVAAGGGRGTSFLSEGAGGFGAGSGLG